MSRLEEFILSVEHRGSGSLEDRHRMVTRVFAKDGALIAESDPAALMLVEEAREKAEEMRDRTAQILKDYEKTGETASLGIVGPLLEALLAKIVKAERALRCGQVDGE
jgi:hypothetical protein